MTLNPYIPCDGQRQSGGSTQIPSLTGYEPKSVEFKDLETEVIEPEDLEPRRIELGQESWDRSVSNTEEIYEKLC